MDVLLVVDMQEGLLRGAPKRDLGGVVERINSLAARVRQRGGAVFFVRHDGPAGDDFEPLTPGWRLLSSLAADTVSDRPHLSAERVIEHHHWVWANMLAPRPVVIARAADL